MPELPEVEIVKRGMARSMQGCAVDSVVFNRGDLRFPLPESLPESLRGRVLARLQRRGKYILGFAAGGAGFVLHLGMSGRIKIFEPDQAYVPQKHDHVVIRMEGGVVVVLNDARRFGFLLGVDEQSWEKGEPFASMGPEPLENEFDGPCLQRALEARRGPIKPALLDQHAVAGIGNIYACEALFRAGIAPQRPACSLNADEASALVRALKAVLLEAIEAGGSSLRDYHNTKGDLGYFQHHFAVYDRAGHGCPGCDCDRIKTGGVQRIVQGGRSTFYCPYKQG
ncbi:MAG: bifunctional DNA-formamidopyrimidine glycosylase/DNA-(apurinic or apyrimidinic site) lyase [Alphaproteobacteria bacterium]|nr:bifunctional DNA-formamidopyrimidine glycosylase/DNA-(apurinic or apyrimidinic site) lyase [Alphaproteobacteria bacterium]